MPCGNTVAMVGLDQFITKNATLTSEKADDAHPIKAMKFSVSPVVSGRQSRVVFASALHGPLESVPDRRFSRLRAVSASCRCRYSSTWAVTLCSLHALPTQNSQQAKSSF